MKGVNGKGITNEEEYKSVRNMVRWSICVCESSVNCEGRKQQRENNNNHPETKLDRHDRNFRLFIDIENLN